jgi:hypothetical protein
MICYILQFGVAHFLTRREMLMYNVIQLATWWPFGAASMAVGGCCNDKGARLGISHLMYDNYLYV